MIEEYETYACVVAQRRYCDEHNLPHFAPNSGICYRCKRQIYAGPNGWTYDQAGAKMITYCPYCNASFDD